MDERERRISEISRRFARNLPKDPDGKIGYSDSHVALSVTVFIKYRSKILLLKRSDRVRTYQGKWCPVAGYLEELKPIRQKALEEVQEETGISRNSISSIHIGKPYEFNDPKLGITWIDHPVLLELKKKPEIKLDWEHTEYRWIKPEELDKFDTVPELHKTLENALM
jgi:8-oxo-dGTP diphosphatase